MLKSVGKNEAVDPAGGEVDYGFRRKTVGGVGMGWGCWREATTHYRCSFYHYLLLLIKTKSALTRQQISEMIVKHIFASKILQCTK